MGTIQVVTATGETQTWDEGIHIASGYAYLKQGDFGWNIEHPPLVKLLSALPLILLDPDVPRQVERDQVKLGFEFLYRNRVPADTLLLAARSVPILITLAGGLALALWVRRRMGTAAALIALAFFALDPNLIAHGRYVTTDVAMAVLFFLSCATWCDYLMDGRPVKLLVASLCFGLAMVAKFSALLLIPGLALLYLVRAWQKPHEFPIRRAALAATAMGAFWFAAVALAYGPETVRCFQETRPKFHKIARRDNLAGELIYQVARKTGLPRHAYLEGLDSVLSHASGGHEAYLLGRRSSTGWWYYFPVTFAVKSTLAACAALALTAGAFVWMLKRRREAGCADIIPFPWLGMALPSTVFFLGCMVSGLNIGVRHILPVYPALYALAGAVLSVMAGNRRVRYTAAAVLSLQAVECASIYPHYLAFFNAAAGGPANGPRILVDSNIDWGQDLKKLARWLETHGTRRVWITYFGKADLAYYGIQEESLPSAKETERWKTIDGFAAVSVTPLQGVYVPWEDLEPLRHLPVYARIGYSIYIYDFRGLQGRVPVR